MLTSVHFSWVENPKFLGIKPTYNTAINTTGFDYCNFYFDLETVKFRVENIHFRLKNTLFDMPERFLICLNDFHIPQ